MMDDRVRKSVQQAKAAMAQRAQAMLSPTGKLPPQALELESAVLGALMLEKDALTTVSDILKPESFYKEAHQRIYKAIQELFDDSEPIDMLTVMQRLRTKGELELVGGPVYLHQLTNKVTSAANIEFHARIVTENAIKRELISMASQMLTAAYEDTTDVFDLLDQTEKVLYEVSESNIRSNYDNMQSLLGKAIKELEAKRDQKDGLTGVPTGLTALDALTSGWQKSDLVIIAARPAMGKTAFVLSVMRNAAVDHGKPVAIFSLEMSNIQLVNRLISAEAELESDKIKKGNLAEYEWAQLNHKIARLSQAPIFIDDTPGLSIRELRTKCRRLKQRHKIELIIIDYMQLMSGNSSEKGGFGGNREQEIASISRALKGIAKELDVPVIALSQLSRKVEERPGDKRPQLSDLRESGSIEQDADMVMFLYRPEYYKIEHYEDGEPTKNVGEVIIAKHRNGSLDTVKLGFIGRFTKFQDLGGPSGGFGGPAGAGANISSFSTASTFDQEQPKPTTIRLGSRLNNDVGFGKPLPPSDDAPPF